jgi:stringent starvation protein B
MIMAMTANRPYLIRAYYDWILDNNCTPYLMVNALAEGVDVPQRFVSDGQIVLNIAPRAVQALVLENEQIRFNTRFGGLPTDIYVPVYAVLGIYAHENGQGVIFEREEFQEPPPDGTSPKTGGVKDDKYRLRVVK